MAHADVILPTQPARGLPAIRSIGLGDLKYALGKGLEDFRAMPTHVIFLSLIYPIAGLLLWRATLGYDFSNRASSVPGQDFRDHTIHAGIKLAL